MLGSDELLDCITAAMIHSDFFSSYDDEEDHSDYHKRSRHSSDSSLSSFGQKEDCIESLCDQAVLGEDCSIPQLKFSSRPILKGIRKFTKCKVVQTVQAPSTSVGTEQATKGSDELVLEYGSALTTQNEILQA